MLVALVMVSIIGISAAWPAFNFVPVTKQNAGTEITFNRSMSVEQSVQGQGYSMQYLYAKADTAELKEYSHGSGSLDQETIFTAYSSNKTNHLPEANWNDFDENCIKFQTTVNSWTYAPSSFTFGTGFYAQPVNYESLLKEKTWVKNRLVGTSIHNEIEYAHAVKKDISAIVKTKYNNTYDPVYDAVGFTEMRIDETVTDGKIHIGALQDSWDNKFGMAWRNPDLEIDEDYVGTYHILKNIAINDPFKWNKPSYDWLPCCSGGWDSIPASYKGGFGASTKGIFDCTCYKWPQTAQFPEPK
jgi:hypothetical protein